jgi:ataxia telangiectasia mutated family protein
MEDKVMIWLSDTWVSLDSSMKAAPGTGKFRIEQRTVADMLGLLENACGFKNRSDLVCAIPLPDHPIVNLREGQLGTGAIRNFLLTARLGLEQNRRHCIKTPPRDAPTLSSTSSTMESTAPVGRERKASSLLLKALENAQAYWESRADIQAARPAAELIRKSLDLAILSMTFETSLKMNNIRSTLRVQAAACKLFTILCPYLGSAFSGWSGDESLLLSAAFLTLTLDAPLKPMYPSWTAFIEAPKSSGVRKLHASEDEHVPRSGSLEVERRSRRQFLRSLWGCCEASRC